MTSQPIRAVYHDGQLHLLDPVNLAEGEEIQFMILSDKERVIAALGDLLVEIPDPDLMGENLNEVFCLEENYHCGGVTTPPQCFLEAY